MVEWSLSESLNQTLRIRKVRVIAAAAGDWNRASLRRKHLDDGMGPILREVEVKEHPTWKNITERSPTYRSYWAQLELPGDQRQLVVT